MPMPKEGQTKDEYIAEFMKAPHAQHFPEDQRVAVAEHEWASHNGEHDEKKEGTFVSLAGDVRYESDGVLRYEAAVSDVKPNFNPETHVLSGVRIMNAKPTRKDYFYNLEAQQRVVKKFEGLVTGVDHDYKSGPPILDRSVGKVLSAKCDANGSLGDIQLNPGHKNYEQIVADFSTGLNTISLSAICSRCEQKGNEVTNFEPVGLDFVINAGQTTKLWEQAVPSASLPASVSTVVPVVGDVPTPVVADSRLEQALSDIELLKGKLTRMEQVAPATVAADVVRMEQALVQRGVNLDQFHAEFLKSK